MAVSSRWHVIVLAAGRGTRMGGPKALMRVNGRPWWQIQEERLTATGLARTWVVSAEVATAMQSCASPLITGDPAAPMFESVRIGIAASPRDSGVFILPVDVPVPAPNVFRSLALAAADGVAIPVYRGSHGHPVALSRVWITRVLAPALATGRPQRLDELIGPHATYIPVDDQAVVVNLNSPADVLRWTRE